MGYIKRNSIIILILLFSVSALLIHARSEQPPPKKSRPLESALNPIPGWVHKGPVELDSGIIQSLELDDFINAAYKRGSQQVSLYVGYYLTSQKVGAAHDPLVCFPGQGWSISDQETVTISIPGHPPLKTAMMVTELGRRKELVIYWFQAYDTPSSSTFQQKLTLLWKRIAARGQDNAFVRVNTALGGSTIAEQKNVLIDFIASFYPLLIDFVHDGHRASRPLDTATRNT